MNKSGKMNVNYYAGIVIDFFCRYFADSLQTLCSIRDRLLRVPFFYTIFAPKFYNYGKEKQTRSSL